MSRFNNKHFIEQDQEPLGPLANLIDIILVFACGLIAALIAQSGELQQHFRKREPVVVEKGSELPALPEQIGQTGEGYESVGRVYRDPKTGKLILIQQTGK